MKVRQEAEGKRHGVGTPGRVVPPGVPFRALCGAEVTPVLADYRTDGYPDSTCWDCDRVWREIEGMEPHPDADVLGSSSVRTR